MDFFVVFCLFEVHVENELTSELLFERLLAGTSHLCLVNDFLASFCVQHIMMSVWFGPLIQAPPLNQFRFPLPSRTTVAATAFLSHHSSISAHSNSQTRDNRSVILFLLSFPFFFLRLFILIIFISLPRHRYRALLG